MERTTHNKSNGHPRSSGVVEVSLFDHSAENHLNTMSAIRKLCGTVEEEEEGEEAVDTDEIERFRSSVTFIRDFKHFHYAPRTVKFSCDTEGQQGKDFICEENLPQFSAVNVPKTERLLSVTRSPEASTDYVLYVGGHVWALDWCPNVGQQSDCRTKCEYLAVSAHPPESSYHKIGVPLIGRGVIQIWCLVHVVKEEELHIDPLQLKNSMSKKECKDFLKGKSLFKKGRGRPRKKKDTDESLDDTDDGIDSSDWENETVQGPAARFRDAIEEKPLPLRKTRGRPRKQKDMKESSDDLETHDRDDPLQMTNRMPGKECKDVSKGKSLFKKGRGIPRKKKDADESLGDTDGGIDSSDRENEMVQGPAARIRDVIEEKPLPLKKTRGRPRKQKDMKESTVDLENHDRDDGSDNSNDENKMLQDAAVHICDKEDEKSPPMRKTRGRPRKQTNRMESLIGLDAKNKSSSILVDIVDSTEPTRSKRHAMLDDLSTGNQMVQETDVQLGDSREEKSIPPKKGRGRPRKQKDMLKSLVDLDAENKPSPTFSPDIAQVSSGFLGLTEATKSPGHALPIILGSNDELYDSRRDHLMVEAIQLCDVKEEKTHRRRGRPRKKIHPRRGRPRKKKDMEEPLANLHTEKEDTSQVLSGFLTSTEATRNTNEHAPLKNCSTDDVLDKYNKNQIVQATSVQPCDVKEHTSLPLKKGRRPGKQAIKKFLLALEAESETDSAVPTEKDTRRKSHDMDDRLNSDRENQIIQATSVKIFDAKEKEPLPSIKTRGRTRKQSEIKEDLVDPETENNSVPALAVDIPEVPSAFLASTEAHIPCCDTNVERETETISQRGYKKPLKRRNMKGKSKTMSNRGRSNALVLAQDEDLHVAVDDPKGNEGNAQEGVTFFSDVANNEPLKISTSRFELPKDVALPRIVLCLAHNGKVAWDVKWQPPTKSGDEEHKHRMGYLAVLLGNGSLEVWEIPSPRAIEILYSSLKKEGRDPRFVKLEPVFKCSKLKSGDRHSIPLTVEWSRSSPHNLLLAGCHDGTVALWKFSPSGTPQDTRPLLCFSADTLPIRALAWAPDKSDEESANIVATAGHGGIQFWDLRDPYRPLWEFSPVRRFIYSIDWLQDPRCVMMTYDDGIVRILSLSKISSEVPVTGKPPDGTQQPCSQNHSNSSYAIWSIHTSRRTGQVLYCGADGSVRCFQLTRKMIDHDHSRNRMPHFLCGSLAQEDNTLTVNTPWPNIPLQMKKHGPKPWGDAPSSIQDVMFLNQKTRANEQTPERYSIALGQDNVSLGSGKISASKSKTTAKKRKIEPAPIQVDKSPKSEKRENMHTQIEILPPKMVALHRVRWNLNRGSERWVCYGGAAGIVRCQEMSLASTMPND